MVIMMDLRILKNKAKEENIPIVREETLKKILEIIKEKNIKNILEIGSAIGYSSIVFALLDKNIKVLTIEKEKNRYLEAKKNINNFNLDNQIEIINGDANEILQSEEFNIRYKIFLGKERFDMIFIDAAKGQYLKFLNNSLRYLKKEGYIVADNVLFHGYVLGIYEGKKHRTIVNNLRSFLNVLKDEEKYVTYVYEIGDGLLISKLK